LEINVNNESKIVEIWLTNAEKVDAALRERLKPLYREYRAKKYLVAVFESGEGDLFEGTRDLLLHNREALTKRELAEEKQAEQKMA